MIYVIGGAGFVGRSLTAALTGIGYSVRVLDKALEGGSFVDVTNPQTFESLGKSDAVINLAAEHRDDVRPKSLYYEVNVRGAANVCQFCRENGTETIIFTSSVAVYGQRRGKIDEHAPLVPENEYGKTKMQAEEIYVNWFREDPNKRKLVIVRPAVIFGKENRGNVYNLFKQIATNRFIMLGSGKNEKSMAYVENVADFLAHCMSLEPGMHIYNYADKPDMDMNSLVALCRRVLLKKSGVGWRIPKHLGIALGYCFDGLAMITKSKLPISSVRVKKFIADSAFETSISQTGFKATHSLPPALERTLRHEFMKDDRK